MRSRGKAEPTTHYTCITVQSHCEMNNFTTLLKIIMYRSCITLGVYRQCMGAHTNE